MPVTISTGNSKVQLQTSNEPLAVDAEPPPKAGPPGAPGPTPWLPPVAWDALTAFVVGPPASFVVWQGSSYVAIAPSTGLQPDLHPEAWQLIVQGGGGPVAFEQTFQASDTWTAVHNLGFTPAVTCYSTDGGQIWGRIVSNDATTTVVQYGFPVPGRISLS